MSLIIQYCEGCGERIPSDALENGEALLFQDSYFFGPCKAKILAEHPELASQAPQPRSQQGGYRASGVFETPIAPDTRRHAKSSSSVRMQRKSGAAAPSAGTATSPASTRRPETSRRAPKGGAGGAGGDQKLVLAAVGGVALVLVVAIVAMSGGSPSGTGSGAGSVPDPTPPTKHVGSGSGKGTPPLVRDEHAEKLAAFEKKVTANPTKYMDHLEEAAELERLFAGGPHVVKLREIKARVEARLRDDGARAFAEIKKAADELILASKFDEAIARWDTFDATLMSDDIRKSIVAEKEKVEVARRRAGPAHQDKIPTDGEQLDLLGGGVKWYTASGGEPWVLVEGEFTAPASAQRSFTFACKGSNTSFGDFYLTFEYQLGAGQLALVIRAPDNNNEGQPNTLNLPVTPAGWKRVHVVARGEVVQTWYEGEKDSFVQTPATVTAGAIGLIAAPNTVAKVRLVEARVQAFGRDLVINQPTPTTPAADVPPLPVPVPAKQRPLFEGNNLSGWTLSNAAEWTIEGGVLKGRANGNQTWLRTGDVSWTGYTVRFEYRKVVGQLTVCYNWREGDPPGFNIPASPPGSEEWAQCVLVVKATDITAYPVRDGKVVGNPLHTKFAQSSGKFGLKLTGDNSAEIRNITFERHD